ncbi:serine/arginine repetitive matrix protein 1-like isoform X2 [Phlebotomus papatasi]|nr:serine/arginine repetitive matrix protein 1-like isoform X2 [Phlebotomus papatasi]
MRRRMSYDDDDDLESLRLAALQTLNHTRKPNSNPIQVVESIVPHHKPIYEEEIYSQAIPGSLPEGSFRPAETFGASGTSNGQWRSPGESYVPPYVAPGAPTDVQLSPRSAAFVLQNTSILRRRKGDKSPSVTPPPYKSPEYPFRAHSRSRTPSPERIPSPVYRHRSPSPKRFYSRSPVRRERSVSRSPPPPVHRRRSRSRSPLVRRQSPRFRSRNSSPRPVRSRRQSPLPRQSPPLRNVRKPSRSPVRVTRHRSQSPPKRTKSPLVRKPARRPREPPRRRSPDRNIRRRQRNPPPREKDEKPRRRSRSRSPVPEKKVEEEKRRGSPEKKPEEKTQEKSQEKPQEKPQEEAQQSSSEEELPESKEEPEKKEDPESDGENGGYEIDLFASDESESENEGRFKSSSKSERPAQNTVSFTKLVAEPVATLTELKDLPSLSNVGGNRERRPERSSRDYGRNRRKRDRDRRNNQRYRGEKSGKDDKEARSKNTKESNMKMFKSTFQAVVVNDSKKANDAADGLGEKGVREGDKRKIIQIKRPISFKETKDKSETNSASNNQPSAGGIGEGKVKKSIHLRLGGYATPNGEPSSSSLASVLASTSKGPKSGNLASLKKSWKTSEKV